jgi:hypothetical protein
MKKFPAVNFLQLLVIKTLDLGLDPDPLWDLNPKLEKMLDPDPHKINADPQPCLNQCGGFGMIYF